MFKIFSATIMAGALVCSNANAGCNGANGQMPRSGATLPQSLAVAALFCADNSIKSKPAAYRFEEGRQADANFLTLLVLLRMQSLSEQNKRPQ